MTWHVPLRATQLVPISMQMHPPQSPTPQNTKKGVLTESCPLSHTHALPEHIIVTFKSLPPAFNTIKPHSVTQLRAAVTSRAQKCSMGSICGDPVGHPALAAAANGNSNRLVATATPGTLRLSSNHVLMGNDSTTVLARHTKQM